MPLHNSILPGSAPQVNNNLYLPTQNAQPPTASHQRLETPEAMALEYRFLGGVVVLFCIQQPAMGHQRRGTFQLGHGLFLEPALLPGHDTYRPFCDSIV